MEESRNVTVVKDADGKGIVLINDIRFKGKREVDWDTVKEYLFEYVGDVYEISNTKDLVYIGTDLPDEYTGSEYTESLRGGNAKAKANATQGIPELLSIATGKFYRKNTAKKHLRDAKYGCYRYKKRNEQLSRPSRLTRQKTHFLILIIKAKLVCVNIFLTSRI